MKKRIEKVVERTSNENARLTKGDKHLVHSESDKYYSVMDDDGDISPFHKINFKVVSEKEILEFETDIIRCRDSQVTLELMQDLSDIDLTDYDIKVIATPKDKTYEEMSKEELIELLKSKE